MVVGCIDMNLKGQSHLLLFVEMLWEKFSHSNLFFLLVLQLITQINSMHEQKAAWFESNFYVSCASYIVTLLTTDCGPLLHANIH